MKAVPKTPYLFQRKGTYYFRRRVPDDLVEALGKKEIRLSLGTSDHREASQRARREAVNWDAEFEAARSGTNARSVDHLSDADLQGIVRRWFQERDRGSIHAEAMGGILDADEMEEAKVTLETDIQYAEGHLQHVYGPIDDRSQAATAQRLLSANGLQADETSDGFKKLVALVRRAEVELLNRQLQRLDGDQSATTSDKVFKGISGDDPKLPSAASPVSVITISKLVDRFLSDPGRPALSEKSKLDYKVIYDVLKELLGADKPVSEIKRSDCTKVREILMRLPPNARKRFPHLSVLERADQADREDLPRIAKNTINSYLSKLSALFGWAVREEYLDRNPATHLMLPVSRQEQKEARLPFSVAQLQAIFSGPQHEKIPMARENEQGDGGRRNARFWIPLTGLFTGMRLNEICQLRTCDIRKRDGIDCIFVGGEDSGDVGKEEDVIRLKTRAARRVIPVHPTLKKIGFLGFVKTQKTSGQALLFPELEGGSTPYVSDKFQKWYSRYLTKVGAKTKRTSFHSFRHNFRDALREADVSSERVKSLCGWSGSGSVDQIYGGGLSAKSLAREVSKVRYAGLDLNHLISEATQKNLKPVAN